MPYIGRGLPIIKYLIVSFTPVDRDVIHTESYRDMKSGMLGRILTSGADFLRACCYNSLRRLKFLRPAVFPPSLLESHVGREEAH